MHYTISSLLKEGKAVILYETESILGDLRKFRRKKGEEQKSLIKYM